MVHTWLNTVDSNDFWWFEVLDLSRKLFLSGVIVFVEQGSNEQILLAIAVFYVRKIVKIMPFMFVLQTDINGDGRVDKYHPYLASEYSGEVMIALVLIGAQFNLIKKLDLLSRRLYKWLYNEEKTVQHSLGL